MIKKFKVLYKESIGIKQHYVEFVRSLPLIVIELDMKGRITFLNTAGHEILELDNYDLDRGVYIGQMILQEQREFFKEDFLYVLEGGLNKGQEYFLKSKKGINYSISIYFSRIINNDIVEGVRGVIIDVSRNKELERKSFQVVIDTEERERKRFSEDLHDGLGPLLSTIKLYINQMNNSKVSDKERLELLAFANDLIDEAIGSTRKIANNIRPSTISDNGLWAAVTSFCNSIEQTGIIQFVLVNNTELNLKNVVENNIYRIIIELVNNTLKHAHAVTINISMEVIDDSFKIVYSDDGIGIEDDAGKGLGLQNIKSRCKSLNGQYNIYNSNGMRFEVLLPLNEIINY
ncbi:MAG: PAS domain S-box protein [Bacteroidales bacterium]|nr:PAS domain S-box protein [Bacteroidales bacterium]